MASKVRVEIKVPAKAPVKAQVPAKAPAKVQVDVKAPAKAQLAAKVAVKIAVEAKKEDKVLIARMRGLEFTESALWGMSAATLDKHVGKITAKEDVAILAQRELRKKYAFSSKGELDELATKLGVPYSNRTRGGVIDGILAAPESVARLITIEDLDEDQNAFVERWDDALQVTAAGPGAGKTTAMCAHVARVVQESPDTAKLMLAYNTEARKILIARLKMFGVEVESKKNISTGAPGVYVLTFDEYGYWSRTAQGTSSMASTDDVYDMPAEDVYDAPAEEVEDAPAEAEDAPAEDEVASELEGLSLEEKTTQPAAKEYKAKPFWGGKWAKGSSDKKDASSGFRRALETAAQIPALDTEVLGFVYVDESQDVLPIHSQIIEQLRERTPHFICAGDPRQQLYPGAAWFSLLWASLPKEQQHVLRYNHRSTPAIVDFLNRFSRTHFRLLHHDQICARKDDVKGVVEFTIARANDGGTLAGTIMAKHNPGDAYTISPVSVKKFRTEPIVNTIRQTMYTKKIGSTTTVFDDHNSAATLDPGCYAVGTSYKFKGTERKCVSVIQPDASYEKCGVPRVSLVKLLFVACSRARDDLHIIMNAQPRTGSIFAPLVPATVGTRAAEQVKIATPLQYLAVYDDLSSLECWEQPAPDPVSEFEPLEISVAGDPDFVGIFAEAHVATASGVELKFPRLRSVGMKGNAQTEKPGVYCTGAGEFEAVIHRAKWAAFRDGFDALHGAFEEHPQYAFAATKYTMEIEKPWTVSERLQRSGTAPDKETLDYAASIVHWWTEGFTLAYCRRVSHPISLHRSTLVAGTIEGVIDFAGERKGAVAAVIEMKHAAASDRHARQAGIYAAIAGVPSAIVLNTKTGIIEKVAAVDLSLLNDVARATLALKHATTAAVRLPKRIQHTPKNSTYISVDTESNGKGVLTEIAAVAFTVGTDKVLGRFARVAAGVAPSRGRGLFDTGLEVIDAEACAEDTPSLIAEFQSWVESTCGVATFLHWGGNDLATLGIDVSVSTTIDVYSQFRAWHSMTRTSRASNLKLTDAVREIMGPAEPFAPHRAFEDAVMTAAVFCAMSDASGIL